MRNEVDTYLAQRAAEGFTRASVIGYRNKIVCLMDFLRSIEIRRWQNVRPENIDAFIDWLNRRGLSFSTRLGIIVTARCFLRWMAEHGKILFNPARHIAVPRPDQDDFPLIAPPLSEEEVGTFLASLPRRNVVDLRNIAHVELLYSAGLRLNESLSLDVKDVDFANRLVHVCKGKGSKPRDVPMMRGLQAALRDYLCLRRSLLKGPDTGALLLTQKGTRMDRFVIGRLVAGLGKKFKRRIHPHLFRHSIAVHLLRGGADVRYVQAFLGHETLESTKIYLRLVPSDLRKAYDAAMPEIAV